MARRKDFNSSSLMILLAVLALIKDKIPINEVKSKLNKLLGNLGLVKKILDDHFGLKISNFIIDTLETKNNFVRSPIGNILGLLPILDPERILTKIDF